VLVRTNASWHLGKLNATAWLWLSPPYAYSFDSIAGAGSFVQVHVLCVDYSPNFPFLAAGAKAEETSTTMGSLPLSEGLWPPIYHN
jgi:hypothetical protein